MPDISMCGRMDCAIAPNCYRHPDSGTCPSSWQSWFAPEQPGPDCISFWPINDRAEQLTGSRPASPQSPDAPAAPPAGVSFTRPIGDPAPGTNVPGPGAPRP